MTATLICTFVLATAHPAGESLSSAPAVVHRRANEFTLSGQHEAAVDADASGAVAAAWTSRRQRGGHSGVVVRWFDADGQPASGEIPVAAGEEGAERSPAISLDGRGAAWVTWVLEGLVDGRSAIMAARIDPAASTGRTPVIRVGGGGGEGGCADAPVVAALADGGAVFAWLLRNDRDDTGRILVQAFDGSGVARGPAREVDVHAPWGRTPTVARLTTGDVLLVWAACDRAGEHTGLRLARIAPDGGPLGAPEDLAIDAPGADGAFGIEPALGPGAEEEGPALAWMQWIDGEYAVMAATLDERGCPSEPALLVAPRADERSAHGGDRACLSGAAAAAIGDGRLAVAWTEQNAVGGSMVRLSLVDDGDGTLVPMSARAGGREPGDMMKGALRAASGARRLVRGGDDGHFRLFVAWNGDAGLGDRSGVHLAIAGDDMPRLPASTADRGSAPPAAPRAEPHEPPSYDSRLVEAPNDSREPPLAGVETVGFLGFNNSGWTPPDPSVAVGPSHLMGIVNGHIALFSRTGAVLFNMDIEGAGGFWGAVGATNFVFDPEVVFDPIHDRFWAMASEGNVGSKSYILLAVSKTANPVADGFHLYRVDTTPWGSPVFDSPNLCVGADAVYVSGDPDGGAYPIFVLPVAPLLTGGPASIANVAQLATSTQSAGIPDVQPPDCPALYLVEHKETNPATAVRLAALVDGLGTPAFFSVDVPVESYTPPEDPPQKGTSVRPETFDTRFWSAAWRSTPEDGPGAGALWATHHVNSSRVRARWYEFRTNGWPFTGSQPTLAQWGEIDLGGTVRTFFSAIGVDAQGNAAITCARSSPTEHISMITARRAADDAPGAFRAPTTEQLSTGPDTSGRWGDYAAVRPDPVDPRVFWAHHEYRTTSWKTWIARRRLALPDINMDGVVDAADLGILLSLWGDGVNSPGDLDGNGIVDAADLGELLAAWE